MERFIGLGGQGGSESCFTVSVDAFTIHGPVAVHEPVAVATFARVQGPEPCDITVRGLSRLALRPPACGCFGFAAVALLHCLAAPCSCSRKAAGDLGFHDRVFRVDDPVQGTSARGSLTRSARNSSHVRLPTARSGARLAPARTACAARPGSRTGRIGR